MPTVFSETLVRSRKEAGFSTAYRFYHDNGGAAAFKVSYRNYLMMEQGRNLPVLGRLARILVALRMPQASPVARDLTRAWLRTMAGDEMYADLLEPLFSPAAPGGPGSPADEALRRTLAENKFHITLEQLEALSSSFETFKCSFTLESDSGSWTAESLAKAVGIKKAEAAKALRDLLKTELVKAEGKAAYRSRVAGKLVEYPATAALRPEIRTRIKGYFKRLEQESPVEFANMGMLRADADALRGYYAMLKSAVEASHAYSTVKKTPKSAGFYIVTRVHRLWNF